MTPAVGAAIALPVGLHNENLRSADAERGHGSHGRHGGMHDVGQAVERAELPIVGVG